MNYTRRSYQGPADQPLMRTVVEAAASEHLHVVDLPYRFSSWAFDSPEQASLWFTPTGQLHAWACLQTPFWSLDYALHPDASPPLHGVVLDWADAQAQAARPTDYGRPMWFVSIFRDQTASLDALEAAGFASQADVGENSWSKVWMHHHQAGTERAGALPPGFTIRPLAGAAEVPAYVRLHREAFGSESMTEGWRAATLQRSEYRSALDLVAVAPDGQLAAFCVGWFTSIGPNNEPSGQIEPLGVGPAFRHLGLGRAIARECISRLYAYGAAHVYVETDDREGAALTLYEAVGFMEHRTVWVYRKDCPS